VDDISAKLKTLEAVHESVQSSLKESQANEIKLKKELEAKHAQAIPKLDKKLKPTMTRCKPYYLSLSPPRWRQRPLKKLSFVPFCVTFIPPYLKFLEGVGGDLLGFFSFSATLGFVWKADDGLTRTEAYEDVGNAIDDLMSAACRGVTKKLSLKRASTKVMDTMTNLMSLVPELIRDWQESSAHGASAVPWLCSKHIFLPWTWRRSLGVPKDANVNQLVRKNQWI
jgi:hypothetical protein